MPSDMEQFGQRIKKKRKEKHLSQIEAAEKLGIDKKELIVVEDAYNGILAAKRANIYTYGLKASVVNQNTSCADKQIYSYSEIDL